MREVPEGIGKLEAVYKETIVKEQEDFEQEKVNTISLKRKAKRAARTLNRKERVIMQTTKSDQSLKLLIEEKMIHRLSENYVNAHTKAVSKKHRNQTQRANEGVIYQAELKTQKEEKAQTEKPRRNRQHH